MAASPGAAGCQPWRWARLARRAFDDVRRDAGNGGRSARAAYRQCAWLSCGKFCRRFAHCRRRRGSDAGTAVTEYSKAGSGCVFSCFRVRFCRIGHAGRTPCESGRRGAFCRAGRNGSRADGPADCTDGTGSASRNTNRAADRQPAYADRPRSADSSAGRSSADAAGASVAARAGYSRLGAAARDSAVAANPAAGQPASTQLRAQTDHCGDFACRRPDYRGGALMMWMICLFGGLGAMARYVLDVSIQQGWNRENRRTNRNFPLSTLVINGVASLCAGIAMMSYYSQSVDMDTVMMFVVGFLGGFSTFSTALNEVVSLIRQRRFTLALGYGIATVAVPLICVAAGFGIALLANPA
ncbi:CrcB family protein [Bifidobacterium longum subsp. infantis]|uniref:Fluoride-specific ion channel FluC n=1 Tax=Bifidobacterium longum subsp. infantis TaxID=1682 RepID=A0A4S5BMB2_BIFLI|nr:CrcB family protein [Bifidobacterium longum subsp. infantis]